MYSAYSSPECAKIKDQFNTLKESGRLFGSLPDSFVQKIFRVINKESDKLRIRYNKLRKLKKA